MTLLLGLSGFGDAPTRAIVLRLGQDLHGSAHSPSQAILSPCPTGFAWPVSS